ncbi:Uncharacterised protein [Sphingobacterium daejeonense]|nr:Uncharacterised protein [Sphingobacterium daejeonense]
MSILDRLKHYIENKQLFAKENKVLLAVSGGKDSMLMARLFHDMEQSLHHRSLQFPIKRSRI